MRIDLKIKPNCHWIDAYVQKASYEQLRSQVHCEVTAQRQQATVVSESAKLRQLTQQRCVTLIDLNIENAQTTAATNEHSFPPPQNPASLCFPLLAYHIYALRIACSQ
jgi:hypothetical protein